MKLTSEQLQELKTILGEKWKLRNGSIDEKMVDQCMKNNKYVLIDGIFVNVCGSKPAIKSTMSYDDAKNDPGKSYQRFFDYNFRSAPAYLEVFTSRSGDSSRLLMIPNYWDSNDIRLCCLSYNERDSDRARAVDIDEIIIINDAIREVRTDFSKRLEMYYKKYSDKIYSSGYWVDR